MNHYAHPQPMLSFDKPLDFVVVSHYHADHVNLIDALYKKIGFNTLYSPFVNPKIIVASYAASIEGRLNDNDFKFFRFLSEQNSDLETIKISRDKILEFKNWYQDKKEKNKLFIK